MGENHFESAWAEGAALSTDETIAYAQRRRGERKRPSSGWASFIPTERDVVRLVSEGLANQRHRSTRSWCMKAPRRANA
jgi:DNA-binding NarL/FixJ family response regulator